MPMCAGVARWLLVGFLVTLPTVSLIRGNFYTAPGVLPTVSHVLAANLDVAAAVGTPALVTAFSGIVWAARVFAPSVAVRHAVYVMGVVFAGSAALLAVTDDGGKTHLAAAVLCVGSVLSLHLLWVSYVLSTYAYRIAVAGSAISVAALVIAFSLYGPADAGSWSRGLFVVAEYKTVVTLFVSTVLLLSDALRFRARMRPCAGVDTLY